MTIGLLFLFFGIRLFRTVIAATGFIFGSLLAFIVITNVREQYSFGQHADTITLVVCFAVGVVGAIIGLSIWMLALVGIGALGGFGLALYLLSWQGKTFASTPVARPIFLVSLTVIGGLLSIVYEKSIIIAGTSMIGAVSLCSGIDVFAATGFNYSLQEFLRNRAAIQLTSGNYALLGSCAVLFLLGIAIQASVTGRNSHGFSRKD